MNKLMTFLGTGNYTEQLYQYDQTKVASKFLDELIIEYYSKSKIPIQEVAVITSKAGKNIHGQEFDQLMKKYGLSHQYYIYDESLDEYEMMDEILSVMMEISANVENLYLNLTHTFRSVPYFILNTLKLIHQFHSSLEVKEIFHALVNDNKVYIFPLSQIYIFDQMVNAFKVYNLSGNASMIDQFQQKFNSEMGNSASEDKYFLKGGDKLYLFTQEVLYNYMTSISDEVFGIQRTLHKEFDNPKKSQVQKLYYELLRKATDDNEVFQSILSNENSKKTISQLNVGLAVVRQHIKYERYHAAFTLLYEMLTGLLQNYFKEKNKSIFDDSRAFSRSIYHLHDLLNGKKMDLTKFLNDTKLKEETYLKKLDILRIVLDASFINNSKTLQLLRNQFSHANTAPTQDIRTAKAFIENHIELFENQMKLIVHCIDEFN